MTGRLEEADVARSTRLSDRWKGFNRASLETLYGHSDGAALTAAMLDEAATSGIPADIEAALNLGFRSGFTRDHLPTLLRLLTAEHHYRHEDVVSALEPGRLRGDCTSGSFGGGARE